VLRCVYTDIDGTLVGRDGSMFHGVDQRFSLLVPRALEACSRARVEVVLKSGRRREGVRVAARLIGATSFIYEVGCGLVIDGEAEEFLTGDLQPRDGMNIFQLIEESGAVDLLFEHYEGRLEHHAPWHLKRDISHLMRGDVDAAEADRLLAEHGHGNLRLVDNGVISAPDGRRVHAYHLMPREGSKLRAVARHMQIRGYAREETIAVGDSREDLEVAEVVGRFFLVANAVEHDPEIVSAIGGRPNVTVCEGGHGEGFYEAVVRSLAEAR
jgi:hydroxymethylpyrimidine pyrophosphatase-like HAD family hydrolase